MHELLFSEEEALQMIVNAGWYEGRQVPLDEFEVKLGQQGYQIFPEAQKFLREFGYLEVQYSLYPHYNYEAFSIFPRHVFLEKREPQILAYEQAAGVLLCPVGQGHQGHGLLMIGTNGLLYGGFDEYFWQEPGEGLSALIGMIKRKLASWKTEVIYEDF